jgi:hypothetical protein
MIVASVLTVILGFSLILALPGTYAPVRAQISNTCPLECQSNSPQCQAMSMQPPATRPLPTGAPPLIYYNKRCDQIPCSWRGQVGCGACLKGCNAYCTTCTGTTGGTSGGSTGGSTGGSLPPSTPGGTTDGSNTGGSVPPSTPGGTTGGTKPPLSTECATKCDINKDGMISKDDFKDAATNPTTEALARACQQSCPWSDTTPTDGNTTPSPTDPGNKLAGDCSGPIPGTPDGKVTIQDLEQLRAEMNQERRTNTCDFDGSGKTDIIDFTNYLRDGYIKYNSQPIPQS